MIFTESSPVNSSVTKSEKAQATASLDWEQPSRTRFVINSDGAVATVINPSLVVNDESEM